MFGDWEVQVQERMMRNTSLVYMFRHLNDRVEVLTGDGTIHTVQHGEAFNDDWYFAELTRDQLQAFADTLAKRGVKTVNDHKNEGLLEATAKHLEDMRSLVFKKFGDKEDGKKN